MTRGALALSLLLAAAGPASSAASARTSLELSAREVFVNQQLVLSVVIEHPPDARPRWEPPNLEGFWSERLPSVGRAEGRDASGAVLRTTAFRRALFPSRAGALAIKPSRVFLADADGFEQALAVAGAEVRVRALPEAGRPDGFAGLVGALEIDAYLHPGSVAVGESARLVIEVHGTAAGWDAPPPELERLLGDEIEVFAETPERASGEREGLLTLRRTLRYDLVPRAAKTFRLPPLAIAVFDPGTRRYRVVEGPVLELAAAHSPPPQPSPFESRGYAPVPLHVHWPLLLGPLFVVAAFTAWWFARWWQRALRPRFGRALPLPVVAFERAAEAIGRPEFARLLADAVRAGVQWRHGFDARSLTTPEIAERGADAEAVRLLEALDRARFSGCLERPEALLAEVRRHLAV